MSRRSFMCGIAIAAISTSLCFAICVPCYGQHIHVLLVADTADGKIGDACKVTVQRTQWTFGYLVPGNRYSITTLESERDGYDAQKVLAEVAKATVARDDTFVFLYDGHGARSGGHHYLAMPDGGKLWSQELQNAVRALRCDLQIILTSSCNAPDGMGAQAAAPAGAWDVGRRGIAPIMEELLIHNSGLMHMNSAWPGEFGFTNRSTGSWFFDEFFSYCIRHPTVRPTWRKVDAVLDRELGRRFHNVFGNEYRDDNGYGQNELKTISWSFPRPWPSQSR